MTKQLELNLPRVRVILITDDTVAPEKEQGLTAWMPMRKQRPPVSGWWNLREAGKRMVRTFYVQEKDMWLLSELGDARFTWTELLLNCEWQGLDHPPILEEAKELTAEQWASIPTLRHPLSLPSLSRRSTFCTL